MKRFVIAAVLAMAAVGTAAHAQDESTTADAIFLRLGESIGTYNTCITIGALTAPFDKSKLEIEEFERMSSECRAASGRYIEAYAPLLKNPSINELIIEEEARSVEIAHRLFHDRYEAQK